MNPTLDSSTLIFFIVGMVFGQSYSLNFVKPLLWVHSGPLRKTIRTLLCLSICVGIFYAMYYLTKDSNNETTKFFWVYLMPTLLNSFFAFGILPILC